MNAEVASTAYAYKGNLTARLIENEEQLGNALEPSDESDEDADTPIELKNKRRLSDNEDEGELPDPGNTQLLPRTLGKQLKHSPVKLTNPDRVIKDRGGPADFKRNSMLQRERLPDSKNAPKS